MDQQLQTLIEKYELAALFAREFMSELGKDRALEVMKRGFEKLQTRHGRDLARQLGDNSLEALAAHYHATVPGKDYQEILEVSDRHIALKITRCRALEAFRELGVPGLCRLFCESDHAFIKAFNPQLRLVRTKTIAAGDDCCDHIWMKEAESQGEP